jgi:TatD DNase family protein
VRLIDSHCHLDDRRFDADRADVLARSLAVGVDCWIAPSVAACGWSGLAALAGRMEGVKPAFGLHPWFCAEHGADDLQQLEVLLPQAVAIGECGLDGGRIALVDMQTQLRWFRAQLDLALAHDLPVIVHACKSIDPVCREIRARPGLRGVVHGFTGSRQQAEALIGLGFLLGIGSAITRPQNRRLQTLAAELPPEALLLESDAPDQPPFAHRGERNEPALLLEIAEQLATLRAVSPADLVRQCNLNATELFRL